MPQHPTWAPPGTPAADGAWNFDLRSGRYVPPGEQARAQGTQVNLPQWWDPRQARSADLLVSPPGNQAPPQLLNYTPKTGQVSYPGQPAPAEHTNLSVLPLAPPHPNPGPVGPTQQAMPQLGDPHVGAAGGGGNEPPEAIANRLMMQLMQGQPSGNPGLMGTGTGGAVGAGQDVGVGQETGAKYPWDGLDSATRSWLQSMGVARGEWDALPVGSQTQWIQRAASELPSRPTPGQPGDSAGAAGQENSVVGTYAGSTPVVSGAGTIAGAGAVDAGPSPVQPGSPPPGPEQPAPAAPTDPYGGKRLSPYDEQFRKYAGDLGKNNEFIAAVAAISHGESGWDTNNQRGDGGKSWGLFQMHENSYGRDPRRTDPDYASSVMVPQFAEAYQYLKQQYPQASFNELVLKMAAMVERPAGTQQGAAVPGSRFGLHDNSLPADSAAGQNYTRSVAFVGAPGLDSAGASDTFTSAGNPATTRAAGPFSAAPGDTVFLPDGNGGYTTSTVPGKEATPKFTGYKLDDGSIFVMDSTTGGGHIVGQPQDTVQQLGNGHVLIQHPDGSREERVIPPQPELQFTQGPDGALYQYDPHNPGSLQKVQDGYGPAPLVVGRGIYNRQPGGGLSDPIMTPYDKQAIKGPHGQTLAWDPNDNSTNAITGMEGELVNRGGGAFGTYDWGSGKYDQLADPFQTQATGPYGALESFDPTSGKYTQQSPGEIKEAAGNLIIPPGVEANVYSGLVGVGTPQHVGPQGAPGWQPMPPGMAVGGGQHMTGQGADAPGGSVLDASQQNDGSFAISDQPPNAPGWVSPVDPAQVVGTGHTFGQQVDMEGTHKGTDLQAYRGTPVKAPVDGTVTVQSKPEGLGTQVIVTDAQGQQHILSHLDQVLVQPGQQVKAGQPVGTVGSSGAGSTGPHLDYRTPDANGVFKNPEPLLGPLAQMGRADQPGATGVGADTGAPQWAPPDMTPERIAGLWKIAQAGQEAGLDPERVRALMAIAYTEDAFGGAVGDTTLPGGGSYGAFQFYDKYGQLPAYAQSQGVTPQEAGQQLRADPYAGVGWAAQGYLGDALTQGMGQGLHDADLATYGQQNGQRSVEPQRAGLAYNSIFNTDTSPFYLDNYRGGTNAFTAPQLPTAAPGSGQDVGVGADYATYDPSWGGPTGGFTGDNLWDVPTGAPTDPMGYGMGPTADPIFGGTSYGGGGNFGGPSRSALDPGYNNNPAAHSYGSPSWLPPTQYNYSTGQLYGNPNPYANSYGANPYGGPANIGLTPAEDARNQLQRQQQDQQAQYQQGQLANQKSQIDVSRQQLQQSMQQMQQDYQLQMAKLQQDAAFHQDDVRLQQEQMTLTQQYQNATLQMQSQLANLDSQNRAIDRQLSIYQSALQNPWLQQLTGLAPAWGAPGGPGQTGQQAAQGTLGGGNVQYPSITPPTLSGAPALGGSLTGGLSGGSNVFGAPPTGQPFGGGINPAYAGGVPANVAPGSPGTSGWYPPGSVLPWQQQPQQPATAAQGAGTGNMLAAATAPGGADSSGASGGGGLLGGVAMPAQPDYGTFAGWTPFQQAAFRTQTEMSGTPWPQEQNTLRTAWGAQGYTAPPNQTPLDFANKQQDPMAGLGFNNLVNAFGQDPNAYWQGQQNNWAPAQAAGVSLSGI